MSCNRILDNLPVAIRKMREENGHPFKTYERGFPVGRLEVHSMFQIAWLRPLYNAVPAR